MGLTNLNNIEGWSHSFFFQTKLHQGHTRGPKRAARSRLYPAAAIMAAWPPHPERSEHSKQGSTERRRSPRDKWMSRCRCAEALRWRPFQHLKFGIFKENPIKRTARGTKGTSNQNDRKEMRVSYGVSKWGRALQYCHFTIIQSKIQCIRICTMSVYVGSPVRIALFLIISSFVLKLVSKFFFNVLPL